MKANLQKFLALLLLSLALLVLPRQGHAAPGDFLFQLGTANTFTAPKGVAFDGSGNMYVTDDFRVQVFDRSGNILRSWGSYGSGDGQFGYNTSIAVAGNLVFVAEPYVSDLGNGRIQVFDLTGQYLRKIAAENFYPDAIATDSKGNVYAVSTYGSVVLVFDSNGNVIRKFGSSGTANGQLDYPSDITVDSAGRIYVVDQNKLQIFDNSGNFLISLGPYHVYNGHVAVDSAGDIYVASGPGGTFEVNVYDQYGNFLRQWGEFGYGDGQFNEFGDIAIDSENNVYVTDTLNNRIQIFDSSGKFLKKIGGFGGEFNFLDQGDVATDSGGNVYVCDSGNSRLQVFDSGGKFLRMFHLNVGDNNYPLRLTLDAVGNIYVATGTSIEVYDNSGQDLRGWLVIPPPPLPSSQAYLGDVATDSSGNVYVADQANQLILVYDNKMNVIRAWGSPGTGNGQFSHPIGVALDNSGNVYVADSGNHRIQVFNSSGLFLRGWGSEGSGDGHFYSPTFVAVDGAGTVYVTDYDAATGRSRIQAFDGTGRFLGKWGTYGTGGGQFIHPTGLAVSPSGGIVYVVDSGNDRIQAYAGFGGNIPSQWGTVDIGSVGVPGSASFANGTFTVKGAGANIYGTADAFRFVYQPLNGNGQIIARVMSVQNTNSYAKAGVMIRQSLTANSTHAMVDITPTSGAEFSRRTTAGGSTTPTARTGITAPYWVKLVRSGSSFTGSVSSDGVTWTQVGSATISMIGTVYIGLIVNSHNNAVLCTGTFDSVTVGATGDTAAPTVTAFTIPATSSSLTVPITTLTASDNTGVTGYLVNESSTKPSATASGWSATPPASYTFTSTGTKTLYAWAKDAAGNVSSSRSASVTVSGGALPSPWLTQDIGSVGLIGSASYANGSFTLKGSGADIWGAADAFRFVYKVMTGDGEIVARVASLQNTNSYAKGGVMIRQSLAANSMHAMMDLRPTGGAEFSRRTTTGGATSATTRPGIAAPYWVRLVRSGSTFTGYVSANGTTWSQVGSATINMSSSVYVGILVNSHNNSALCTATIDAVQ
jgi:DNA-binding beta-propeller fold protein YncE